MPTKRSRVPFALLLLSLSAPFLPSHHAYAQKARASTTRSPQHTSPAPPLTDEKAFFYFIAIYGSPDNAVGRYGNYFDASNYRRAMADEFERRQYADRIRATIADGVRRIDFRDKFSLVGSTTHEGYSMLGEYSFASHSFPLINIPYNSFCHNMDHSSGICSGTFLDVRNARVQDAVNGSEFNWAIPMSEADARTFVKGRTIAGSGAINRRVVVRMTYSVTSKKGQLDAYGRGAIFFPFIYSVEVFADESLTNRLGVITAPTGTPASAFLPEAAQAAQVATKVGGKYQYIAGCREAYRCVTPIVGTITLTDASIELSGDQRDGSAKPLKRSFADAFAGTGTKLWRANFTNGTWGGSDFRVVWQPFWERDYQTGLVFANRTERDRFFLDVTAALQQWATKYAQFARSKLTTEQRCEVNTYFVPCSETAPFEVRPSSPEPAAGARGASADTGPPSALSRPLTVDSGNESLAAGEQVIIRVKCNFAASGYIFLREGVIHVSKSAITLKIPVNGVDYGFAVAPVNLLQVKRNSQGVHIRIVDKDWKGKDYKKDYDLYNAAAVTYGVGSDGRIFILGTDNIRCNGCDDTMTVLYATLSQVGAAGR